MDPLKIVVCGPSRAGKSCIANFLGGTTDAIGTPEENYQPTVGVRILECDKPGGSGGRINVEIWDVSGNQNYEACWPAIMKDVRGVILVYNPDVPSHEPEVGIWFDHFVKGAHLQPDCVLGIVHRSKDASRSTRTRPPPNLGDINMVSTAWGNSTSSIASAFDEFIVNVSSMRK